MDIFSAYMGAKNDSYIFGIYQILGLYSPTYGSHGTSVRTPL